MLDPWGMLLLVNRSDGRRRPHREGTGELEVTDKIWPRQKI